MKDFFRKLKEANNNGENIVVTRLEGGHLGERALISDGTVIWKNNENDFFETHTEEIIRLEKSGVNILAGEKVYAEILDREKRIVICGGGHVSMPIIAIGRMIGCRVTVLEDRPLFADNARAAGADEVICDNFEDGLAQVPGDPDTYFVIVTRGHRYDKDCLRLIAQKPHAYIGLMGSRRRVKMVMESLVSEGISKEVLDNVYTPIGLDIASETPEEIAVAVVAEIISVKNRRKKAAGYSRALVHGIIGTDGAEGMTGILATIITRKGSAPREVGTKMLIARDGACIDTIGGGCIEAGLITKARMKFATDDLKPEIVTVSMTDDDAEDAGMVCGGVVDVLLLPVE